MHVHPDIRNGTLYFCHHILVPLPIAAQSTQCIMYCVFQICEMKNCNKCILFEGRLKRDLYMWVANIPSGPSAKFLVENGNSHFFSME
jgi:hypothetical protein